MKNPVHPGEIVRELIISKNGLGMSVSEAARKMGVNRSTLHRLLNGTSKLTLYMSRCLFGLAPNLGVNWLDIQTSYDKDMSEN